MKARVQSLHLLDEKQLAAIWRRSAFDADYRDCLEKIVPPESGGEEDEGGQKKPQPQKQPVAKAREWLKYWLSRDRQSDFGQLEVQGGKYYFWANWLETNRGLVPVLDPEVFGQPIGWRLVINGLNYAIGESVVHAGWRYSLVILNGQPMVIDEEITEEEKHKIFEKARALLGNLSNRLRKFTKEEE